MVLLVLVLVLVLVLLLLLLFDDHADDDVFVRAKLGILCC